VQPELQSDQSALACGVDHLEHVLLLGRNLRDNIHINTLCG
jgi:hypothetical protein